MVNRVSWTENPAVTNGRFLVSDISLEVRWAKSLSRIKSDLHSKHVLYGVAHVATSWGVFALSPATHTWNV